MAPNSLPKNVEKFIGNHGKRSHAVKRRPCKWKLEECSSQGVIALYDDFYRFQIGCGTSEIHCLTLLRKD